MAKGTMMNRCFHPPGSHLAVLVVVRDLFPAIAELVEEIAADAWEGPTPCSQWTVRDLVAHIAGELLWVPAAVAGEEVARSTRRFSTDVLGANPKGVVAHAAEAAVRSLARPGALDRQLRLPYGLRDGLGYARELAADLTVHWWDLSQACPSGAELPERVVASALAQFSEYRDIVASGHFSPPLPCPAGDLGTIRELAARTGRHPGNRP
ncbi:MULTISPECIES: TIGR03086 family metal-binding protein [Kitasatospora]|nr:TIGR03086 family metal-binding protein [Kitasatospora setae]